MPMLADIGTCLVPIWSGMTRASVIREATSEASVSVAVRQHDHEFIAAQTPQHVARLNLRAQALGKLDQQFVAGRMSERIVDVLEIIDIEKRQRDVFSGGTGLDRLGDQIAQARAVRQAGQHVVIGKPRDLGARFLALDRQRAEMDAGIDNALMPAARRHDIP